MTFSENCYSLLRQVPAGKVTTYAAIARALNTYAYRAVGIAMNKNPYPKEEVPCHRVINSNGELGGYANGQDSKRLLLEQEGIRFIKKLKNNGVIYLVVDLEKVLHQFA